jgi:endoglucanase
VRLLGERFSAQALDNRAGVAAILRCLELLKGRQSCDLTVLFSVQEETGGAGAQVAAFHCHAEAVVVDVSFAQAPGIAPEDAQGVLGGGTMIGIAPGLDHGMSQAMLRLAKAHNISHQLEIMGGRTGTNADRMQQSGPGVPCALLSIPLRNMHTAGEIVDMRDVEATARLLSAFIMERGGPC